MILTEQMFINIGANCPMLDEAMAICPLPATYQHFYDSLIEAGKLNIAENLASLKVPLIKETNNYTLGAYRIKENGLFKSEPTLQDVNNELDSIREQYYQENKSLIRSSYVNNLQNGGEVWIPEDFEHMDQDKPQIVYDFQTGQNMPFQNAQEAQQFIGTLIAAIKAQAPMPVIEQMITCNDDGPSAWMEVNPVP